MKVREIIYYVYSPEDENNILTDGVVKTKELTILKEEVENVISNWYETEDLVEEEVEDSDSENIDK